MGNGYERSYLLTRCPGIAFAAPQPQFRAQSHLFCTAALWIHQRKASAASAAVARTDGPTEAAAVAAVAEAASVTLAVAAAAVTAAAMPGPGPTDSFQGWAGSVATSQKRCLTCYRDYQPLLKIKEMLLDHHGYLVSEASSTNILGREGHIRCY